MANASRSSQSYVPIKEIRNGVVLLKDNSLRAVLLASSLNFALKSSEEQQATLLQFQNFLNSLEFPVQISVQSRDLDIRPYVSLLEERYAAQTTDIMQLQTREYIEFVKGFVSTVSIMSKTFFIVVPYSGSVLSRSGGKLSGFFQKKKQNDGTISTFEENITQLEQRVSVVSQGLLRSGVRLARLGTEELVELYYKLFNPGELGKPIPPGSV